LARPGGNTTGFTLSALAAGPQFSLKVTQIRIYRVAELESAISSFPSEPDGALVFPPDIFITTHRNLIIPLADRFKLPAIYPYRYFVEDGGLISYGTSAIESFAQAATYVDRILRGATPANLPVQAPTKYELVINLKTAKALGLVIPTDMLDLADDLVQ
jgi:putative tryptophan/tyrosine transport system substrate-binding protein